MDQANLQEVVAQADAEYHKTIVLHNGRIGILIDDAMNRRLVEAASVQLDLLPVMLNGQELRAADPTGFEMIVADMERAVEIRELLASSDDVGEGILPSIIAASSSPGRASDGQGEQSIDSIDAVLTFPMAPGQIAAQLSVMLYAHRAFARRYQSALEELHLNRRIFRSVTSGISVADATQPDLPLIYVNPAFEVMTGYCLEEVAGKNCRFLQGQERDQPALTLLREAIQAERETVVVLKNFRKDGTPFWNELSLSPIRNREGQLTHFVGIQTDVTARVEFEAALRESEKLAAVGRLASSIAHEINNPLESVVNLIYLANHAKDFSEAREYISTADRELQRVKLITSQSLRFYKQSTRAQAVNPSDLIDSVLDVYSARLSARGIIIDRREETTQSIVCMESEIRQVLNNLVSNALDAMIGKGRLVIRTRETTEWRSNAKGISISVSDTGTGISPSALKNIYTAFYTTKGIRGTGLGLWISSEIVERHHGRLLVRSSQKEGRSGTTFMLFLPYQGLTS